MRPPKIAQYDGVRNADFAVSLLCHAKILFVLGVFIMCFLIIFGIYLYESFFSDFVYMFCPIISPRGGNVGEIMYLYNL